MMDDQVPNLYVKGLFKWKGRKKALFLRLGAKPETLSLSQESATNFNVFVLQMIWVGRVLSKLKILGLFHRYTILLYFIDKQRLRFIEIP